MKDQELVNALRCTSSPGEPIGDCKKCRFYKTEPVPEDLVGKVDLTEWSSCDVDAIGFAAADRIANQSTHIAALQQEIEKLRGQLKTARSKATGGSSTLCVRSAGHWNKLGPRRKGRRSGELSEPPEAWKRRWSDD